MENHFVLHLITQLESTLKENWGKSSCTNQEDWKQTKH